MSEVGNQVNNSSDKVAKLQQEAENLKQKLEEERQKLNDVTCMSFYRFLMVKIPKFYVSYSIVNFGTFGNDKLHKH